MTGEVLEHHHLLMGGKWRKPHSSNLIRVFSANTEFLIGSVPDADRVDVDSAVQTADQARPLRLTHGAP
jgi:aldehyde dehydrogenase (NAD+)